MFVVPEVVTHCIDLLPANKPLLCGALGVVPGGVRPPQLETVLSGAARSAASRVGPPGSVLYSQLVPSSQAQTPWPQILPVRTKILRDLGSVGLAGSLGRLKTQSSSPAFRDSH